MKSKSEIVIYQADEFTKVEVQMVRFSMKMKMK